MTEIFRATIQSDESDLPPMVQGRFPWTLDLEEDELLAAVTKLLSVEDGVPKGSSFIYDTNAPAGKRRLWLSEVSLRRLEEAAADVPPGEGRHLQAE